MNAHWSEKLMALSACNNAIAYARTKPSLAAAWRDCERADWKLWLVGKLVGAQAPETRARRKLAGCTADCAATALRYAPKGERRPARCIRLVRRDRKSVV